MARRSSNLRFQPSGGSRAAQVPVGKKQKLAIERLAGDGRGIAFEGGRTWFVSGALAGEQVEARVLSARSQTVEARAERIIAASSERRANWSWEVAYQRRGAGPDMVSVGVPIPLLGAS